jgi:hypothetical protein
MKKLEREWKELAQVNNWYQRQNTLPPHRRIVLVVLNVTQRTPTRDLLASSLLCLVQFVEKIVAFRWKSCRIPSG